MKTPRIPAIFCAIAALTVMAMAATPANFNWKAPDNFDYGDPKNGRVLVDFNRDGKADFCRVIGDQFPNTFAVCNLSTGVGFQDAPLRSIEIDTGRWMGRAWVDIDGDEFPEFCRITGTDYPNTFLNCAVNNKGVWGSEDLKSGSVDIGDPLAGYYWGDIDGDKAIEYCRRIGGRIKCDTVFPNRETKTLTLKSAPQPTSPTPEKK